MRTWPRFFNILLSAVAFFAVTAAAESISLPQAKTAVANWLKTTPALGCPVGGSITDARTCTVAGKTFHVVKLDSGFVVTSADTGLEPVIAFSDGVDLVERSDNPLWALLCEDFAGRVPEPSPSGTVASAATTSNASKWAQLLSGSSARATRSGGVATLGLSSVSDLRIAPLLQSKWGQEKNSMYGNQGSLCFNYYTPNNYVCGCVATAMAQIMRYHRYPASATAVAKRCAVNGVQQSFAMMGGTYDYDNMKLIPEAYSGCSWYAGGATETQRKAIGKLTYDCGVAMQMDWGSNGSSSGGAAANGPLKAVFGYANAKTTTYTVGLSTETYRSKVIYPNLDAGYPVMVGVAGHMVVADGYGYSNNTLYTHINLGWSGYDDAWYNLPTIVGAQSGYSSSVVQSVVYNIFPDKTGEIVSGRVLSPAGVPAANVTVTIRRTTGGTTQTATTDSHGIFAFIVPGGRVYTVTASTDSATVQKNFTVSNSKDSSVWLEIGQYSYSDASVTCGNVQCGDMRLVSLTPVATPAFSPASGAFYPSVEIVLSCATAGATIRYTLDGSDPTENSAQYRSPFTLTQTTTVKAVAFKSGMAASAVAATTYTLTRPPKIATSTTEVPVPYTWLNTYFPGVATTEDAYEDLAHADNDHDGFATWAEYLAATDPADAASYLRALIRIDNGTPVIECNVTNANVAALGYRYAVKGKATLNPSENWAPADQSHRFFKVFIIPQ